MQIPQFRLDRQIADIKDELKSAFENILDSGQFVLGSSVDEFETTFAGQIGAKHCIGVTSGTDALIVALKANGISSGDCVITTPFTFFATASAILAVGAKPVFADVDPVTFNIDPKAVARALNGECNVLKRCGIAPDQIKAIIAVHLYGLCADMDALKKVAADFKLALIEDAAQAYGSEINRKCAGTFSSAAAFSFFPTKNLGALGDAGCVTTDSDEMAEKMRLVRVHGSKQRYIHEVLGGNFRLDAMQAAFLSVKMKYAASWVDARRKIAGIYDSIFKEQKGLISPAVPEGYKHSYHQYTVRILGKKRQDVIESLSRQGIGCMPYYPLALHLQPALSDLGLKAGDFPVSEMVSGEVLALPMYPELTDNEAETVATALKNCL